MTSGVDNHVRAILFDAGLTLLAPVRPASETYYEFALKRGIEPGQPSFFQRFQHVWADHHQARKQRPLGKWSEQHESEFWSTIASEIAALFPSLFDCWHEWLEDIQGYYDQPEAWKIIDRADLVLPKLRSLGWRIGVVSNWHRGLREIMRAYGLLDSCEFLLTSVEAGHLKPHPEIFLQALNMFRLESEQVIVIGDSWEEDILGARRLGMRTLWISKEQHRDQEFNEERINRLDLLEAKIGLPAK